MDSVELNQIRNLELPAREVRRRAAARVQFAGEVAAKLQGSEPALEAGPIERRATLGRFIEEVGPSVNEVRKDPALRHVLGAIRSLDKELGARRSGNSGRPKRCPGRPGRQPVLERGGRAGWHVRKEERLVAEDPEEIQPNELRVGGIEAAEGSLALNAVDAAVPPGCAAILRQDDLHDPAQRTSSYYAPVIDRSSAAPNRSGAVKWSWTSPRRGTRCSEVAGEGSTVTRLAPNINQVYASQIFETEQV